MKNKKKYRDYKKLSPKCSSNGNISFNIFINIVTILIKLYKLLYLIITFCTT